jgi:TPR repeat protein
VDLRRALNGLGYAYFVGDAVEKNLTKAFGYFERAALIGSDGDSLFNAAHCLEHGHGTEKDLARAAGLYQQAAERFGHFDSAHVLGRDPGIPALRKAHTVVLGIKTKRDFSDDLTSVLTDRQAVHGRAGRRPEFRLGHPLPRAGQPDGPLGQAREGRLRQVRVIQPFHFHPSIVPHPSGVHSCVRRYLARDYLGAYMLYAQAAELGYDVAQANAAYLLDKGLVDIRALVGAPTGGPVDRPTGRPTGQAGGTIMAVDQAYAKLLGWAREALSLRLHWLAYARGGVAEAAVAIGDAYFFGRGGTCCLIAAAALSHML